MADDAETPKPVVLTPYVTPPAQGLTIVRLMQGVAFIAIACAIVIALGALAFPFLGSRLSAASRGSWVFAFSSPRSG